MFSLSGNSADFSGEKHQFAPSAEVPRDIAIKSLLDVIELNIAGVIGEEETQVSHATYQIKIPVHGLNLLFLS